MKKQRQKHSADNAMNRLVSSIHFEAAQARIKLEAELAEVSSELAETSATLAETAEARATAEAELASVKPALAETAAELAATKTKLAALERTLEGIQSSKSWRITAPMRRVAARLRPEDLSKAPEPAGELPAQELPREDPEERAAAEDHAATEDHATSAKSLNGFSFPLESEDYIHGGKEAWDSYGQARLEAFLDGGERISFPRSLHPKLSIIVVLHNKAHLSLLNLLSIRNYSDVDYELILVDNNSHDQTNSVLERLENVIVIRNSINAGFLPACMQASDLCTGDYLCFLNNDAQLHRQTLSNALRVFDLDSRTGAVGGKVLLADGRLQEAGCILWCGGTSDGYGRGSDPEMPKYNFRRPVDYCSGVFLLTPRRLFKDLGGFDEIFGPGYFEDSDYGMRVWEKGHRVIYEPSAVVSHYENASSGASGPLLRRVVMNHYNFFQKWRESLAEHYEPKGPNIHSARIAVADKGMKVLYIECPRTAGGQISGRSRDIIEQLSQQGHHVALASLDADCISPPAPPLSEEVEIVNVTGGPEAALREYFLDADVVWIADSYSLQAAMAMLRKFKEASPTVVWYKRVGTLTSCSITGLPHDIDLDRMGLKAERCDNIPGTAEEENGETAQMSTDGRHIPIFIVSEAKV
jgi:GT2 family glycosyltransferase